MLPSDIMSRVRNIAGDVTALQFTDDQLLSWVNDGIRECAIQNNLLQKRATSTVVSGQSEYALPSDILKLHSVKYAGEKIRLMDMNEFDETVSSMEADDTGNSIFGYVWAGNLVLFPIPSSSTDELIVDYIRDPAEITEDQIDDSVIELPTSYHPRIVDYCLAQVAQQDDDIPRYQLKMQEFKTGVQELKDQPEWSYDEYPSITMSGPHYG